MKRVYVSVYFHHKSSLSLSPKIIESHSHKMTLIKSISGIRGTIGIGDDPYGKIVDFTASGVKTKYKKDRKDYRNGKDFGNAEGEDNLWKWTDVTNNITIKYAEIYCRD